MAKDVVAKLGDCISSLAFIHGFAPDTIWEHDGNRELRELRPNMFQIAPGDRVHIPSLRDKVVTCGLDSAHRFRRRGVPERLRVRLWSDHGKPRAELPYTLEVSGRVEEGATDKAGRVEHWISPLAKRAVLTIEHDTLLEVHEFELGHAQPKPCPPQALARLRELGHLPAQPEPPEPQLLESALRAFQRERGLCESGDYDPATRWSLLEG